MTVDYLVSALAREREALTLELRSLATDLDGIDRELADCAPARRFWHHSQSSAGSRADLEAEHARLTAHLRKSAARLRRIDELMAEAKTAGPLS